MLLEAIVALVILSITVLTVVRSVTEAMRAVARADSADAELVRADQFMGTVALWPRADLDRHLGSRMEGSWILRIENVEPEIYEVILSNTLPDGAGQQAMGRALLQTSLYRPVHRDDR